MFFFFWENQDLFWKLQIYSHKNVPKNINFLTKGSNIINVIII